MNQNVFGKLKDGREVKSYTLGTKQMGFTVLDYGATLQSLFFNGVDVVLGYDNIEKYEENCGYIGKSVGRYANRIKNAEFTYNGKKYILEKNDGNNSLHGGFVGYDSRLWNTVCGENFVEFTYVSPDGECGYDGNITVAIKYVLNDNGVRIEYSAVSDKDTPFNPTNHSYFNLDCKGDIKEHILQINADYFTDTTKDLIPTDITSVDGTPLDFRTPKAIGRDFDSNEFYIASMGGYDHNFIINGDGFKKVAEVYSKKSGIAMECYTDLPGIQLYTAGQLSETNFKNNFTIGKNGALCLETQFFPDSPNRPDFPSSIIKAGEKFFSATEYTFKLK